ncbi:MAG: hypothetical protein BGO82_00835 [Devosia sp. 67-54]|jgi:uncharacterized membrane-anchored protein|uniref:COG4705 family protein n=1 Tax=unclassified Devosia TaxID=196773 RepID=UPI00095BB8FC|nr:MULTISPECIES: hypothetical protein [unclassified Devosia]MBN9305990.1 hypothetical protein [Devosia sp.]OJX16574.1 MAG: hypothetical protein BGO82_00835 [Devosia sp. 67-54]
MTDTAETVGYAVVQTAKVPEVALTFWVVKVLTTGLGETTSDYLVRAFDPPLVIALSGVALTVALVVQWIIPVFSKWRYWIAVSLVAVFGTMVADVIHVVLGVPYLVSTVVFLGGLLIVFACWWWVEKTLSIHSIYTRRRESFYWLTVLATFALGTAAGDMTATTLGLGYFVSGVMFLAAFLVPLVVRRWAGASEISTFWIAYILTRPLGASFADWLGVGPERGGVGLGTGFISLALVVVAWGIVALSTFDAAAISARLDRN